MTPLDLYDDFRLEPCPVPEVREPQAVESWQRYLDEKYPTPEPRS